jgi:RimJ/RimL family protein N-acetyltransferase
MEAPTAAQLNGEFIHVRRAEPQADAYALYPASHGDPTTEALWTYMPYGPFADVGAMWAWLQDCAASADPAFRIVAEKGSGQPLGMAAYLNIEPRHYSLELGHIWYGPQWQRSKVNTETIYLMLCEAFDHLGCRRVEWKCDSLNTASRAAAVRLGFSFEGVARKHMIVKHRNRDTAWYAQLDDAWPAVRKNMERWLYTNEPGLSLSTLNAANVS